MIFLPQKKANTTSAFFINYICDNENPTTGTLRIAVTQNGDRFPAAETFIKDAAGNALFIGVSPFSGNPFTSLAGDNHQQMMSNVFEVRVNHDKIFTSVIRNGVKYSTSEWNKIYTGKSTGGNTSYNVSRWEDGGRGLDGMDDNYD